MKKSLIIVLAIAQAVFMTTLHCDKCALKIRENISFMKGVKDFSCDVDCKTVTVTFDTAKTDTVKIGRAIEKLGYSAKVIEYKEDIKKNWGVDKLFESNIAQDKRTKLIKGWKKAVKTAIFWSEL